MALYYDRTLYLSVINSSVFGYASSCLLVVGWDLGFFLVKTKKNCATVKFLYLITTYTNWVGCCWADTPRCRLRPWKSGWLNLNMAAHTDITGDLHPTDNFTVLGKNILVYLYSLDRILEGNNSLVLYYPLMIILTRRSYKLKLLAPPWQLFLPGGGR